MSWKFTCSIMIYYCRFTDLASSSAHSWMIYVWKCVPFLVLFSVWVMHVKFSKFFHIVFFYSLCFNLKFVDYALSIHRKALPFSFLPQNFRKQLLHLETSQKPAGRLDQLSVLLYVPKGMIPRVHRYSRPAVFHGIKLWSYSQCFVSQCNSTEMSLFVPLFLCPFSLKWTRIFCGLLRHSRPNNMLFFEAWVCRHASNNGK